MLIHEIEQRLKTRRLDSSGQDVGPGIGGSWIWNKRKRKYMANDVATENYLNTARIIAETQGPSGCIGC